MKILKAYFSYLTIALNLLFSIMLLFSAYSPYISPVRHPALACAGMAFPLLLFVQLLFGIWWLLFRWKLMWIPVLSVMLCANAVRTYLPMHWGSQKLPENGENIKILSYNTMAFANGVPHRKGKPNPVLQYLVDADADILCLQECVIYPSRSGLRKIDVERALKSYPYKKYLPIGSGSNRLACFSRYPILSQSRIAYESLYNGSAMYELLVGGDTMVVINNHLESNKLTMEDRKVYHDMIKSPDKQHVERSVQQIAAKLFDAMVIRAFQVDAIAHVVDSLQHRGRTTIVCGDFNDTPISYTHHRLTEQLHSAFVESGSGLGISYNQNGFYFRIDNILLSKDLRSYQCKVDNSLESSDHYPIYCYIAKRN